MTVKERLALWSDDENVPITDTIRPLAPACKWYLSGTAIREWMAIAGYDFTPVNYALAAEELKRLVPLAVFQREFQDGRMEQWRVIARIKGRRRIRLNFAVSTVQRPEGYRDQLVEVRDNDDRSDRRRKN